METKTNAKINFIDMDEVRAAKDEPGVSSSASFRLLDVLAKKERPATPLPED